MKIYLLIKLVDQYEEAIPYYDQALKIKPQLSELWEGKAYCLYIEFSFSFVLRQLNDNEQAVNCYEKALKYDPTSYEALKGMGYLDQLILQVGAYQSLQFKLIIRYLYKCDESIVFFEKALEIMPNNEFSLKGKAECLRLLGKWEEAIKCYSMVLYFNPGQHRAQFFKSPLNNSINLQTLIVQLEQIVTTLKNHEKELAINPKSINSIFGKAECLLLELFYHYKQECQMIMMAQYKFIVKFQNLILIILIH